MGGGNLFPTWTLSNGIQGLGCCVFLGIFYDFQGVIQSDIVNVFVMPISNIGKVTIAKRRRGENLVSTLILSVCFVNCEFLMGNSSGMAIKKKREIILKNFTWKFIMNLLFLSGQCWVSNILSRPIECTQYKSAKAVQVWNRIRVRPKVIFYTFKLHMMSTHDSLHTHLSL